MLLAESTSLTQSMLEQCRQSQCLCMRAGLAGGAPPPEGQVLDRSATPGACRLLKKLAGGEAKAQGGQQCPKGPARPEED